MKSKRVCSVEGCNVKHDAKGYCQKHYYQINKYGKIKERDHRTPNEIIVKGDYAEVVLYDINCEERSRTKIDIDDIELVKSMKWCYLNGYVQNAKNGIRMHRFLTNAPVDKVVDHINRDPLDNRKSNLRICTQAQNTMNAKVKSHSTSGIKGVFFHKRDKLWIARIQTNYKRIRIGGYKNKEDAIKARKQAEDKYFNEYNIKVVE